MAMPVAAQTPAPTAYGAIPQPADPILLSKGYGIRSLSRPSSWVGGPSTYNVVDPPQNAYNGRLHEELHPASQRSSLNLEGSAAMGMRRSVSQASHTPSVIPSRAITLREKASLTKRGSIRRSGSRKSVRAGSVKSISLGDKEKYGVDPSDVNSAFFIPIPTSGNPTEALANRFQAWRKFLKDLIALFKELQKSYESRSKLLLSASNVMNNAAIPQSFIKSGGISAAAEILQDFHHQGYLEANKAVEVETEVVNQLISLRNDLQKKTKEIKNLAGDFRNSVDKEVEGTRKAIRNLHEALGVVDTDPSAASGRGDPFVIRLSVDKQIEKQIEEENYLHRAFLNLEHSGRELESIVVSEIQKAYSAYASILKREADQAYNTVEKLRIGPISMPRDREWNAFIANTDDLIDPRVPLRSVENITYPGVDHPAAAEVRSGMLERKSKYLKSYTPGWYVLSPTHLHEFKSADRLPFQTPVMSLYLPEQKLGSHSQPNSTSYKFMLKGRQTGTMHRGHSWVFRAESYETMMTWYEDIGSLISKTGEARNAFVRRHVRSVSGASVMSSDGILDEDEADRTPYSSKLAVFSHERPTSALRQAGGCFPSDVHIDRHAEMTLSPSSGESSEEKNILAVANPLPDSGTFDISCCSVSDRVVESSSVGAAERATGSETGSALGGHGSFYGECMETAEVVTEGQNLSQQTDSDGQAAGVDEIDMPLQTTASAPVAADSTSSQRARRESGSTGLTSTNITDHTINTLPTSGDGSQEPITATSADTQNKQRSSGEAKDALPAGTEGASTITTSAIPSDDSGTMSPSIHRGQCNTPSFELDIPGRFPPSGAM